MLIVAGAYYCIDSITSCFMRPRSSCREKDGKPDSLNDWKLSLIIGGNFAFQNGLGLTIKAVNSNSPWTCIQEGSSSEGHLRLRFGGLIFGMAHYLFIYLYLFILFYFILFIYLFILLFFFLGGGLIFGRAYLFVCLFVFFLRGGGFGRVYFGGGGAYLGGGYYRNFTLFLKRKTKSGTKIYAN